MGFRVPPHPDRDFEGDQGDRKTYVAARSFRIVFLVMRSPHSSRRVGGMDHAPLSPCLFPKETHRIGSLGSNKQRRNSNSFPKADVPERIGEQVDIEGGRLDFQRLLCWRARRR